MQRYLGIDVHSKSSTICVLSAAGKKVRQDVVETNGQALIGHLGQIPGRLHVCLEEGEWSGWLHEILEPHVAEIVVEHPQWKAGSKSDAIDARGLAEHLRTRQIKTEVYKAPQRFTKLRELAQTYDKLTVDSTRAKNRLRSAYRRRAIPYPGHDLSAQAEALAELPAWMRQSVEVLGIELALIERAARRDRGRDGHRVSPLPDLPHSSDSAGNRTGSSRAAAAHRHHTAPLPARLLLVDASLHVLPEYWQGVREPLGVEITEVPEFQDDLVAGVGLFPKGAEGAQAGPLLLGALEVGAG